MREALLPAVVSLVDMEKGAKGAEKWKVQKSFYPVGLSPDAEALVKEAVKEAVKAWGERQLQELDAEDRLSVACEKAPTDDATIQKLRDAFQKVRPRGCPAQPLILLPLGSSRSDVRDLCRSRRSSRLSPATRRSRSWTSAASMLSEPRGTSPAASTTSCVAVPGARVRSSPLPGLSYPGNSSSGTSRL